MAWHYISGDSVDGDLANGGRQGDAGSTQRETGGGARRRADDEALAVLGDRGLGQCVEIAEDLGPGADLAERGDTVLELDLQHQGQERAEDVAADGLVELVEDGSRGEEVLFGAEDALRRPQLLVAEHGGERVEIGIGAQHEDTVEARVLGNLGTIDDEAALAGGLEEAPIARVAD